MNTIAAQERVAGVECTRVHMRLKAASGGWQSGRVEKEPWKACGWRLSRRVIFFFFSSRRRHTIYWRDWSSDVCSSDLRSTDLLSGLGPPALSPGDVLPVAEPATPMPGVDLAPVPDPPGGEVTVRVLPGPRADWFPAEAAAALTTTAWEVTGESNRIGLRLAGVALERSRTGELASEGMVRGALQVPPSGQPVLFLADPPVTGGYPVIGYVEDTDVDRCGQLRPGQTLRFRGAVHPG